jgi:hypothetical protein
MAKVKANNTKPPMVRAISIGSGIVKRMVYIENK